MDKYEHRKAKTIITLTDKHGRRLCGEKVTARLANHEFLFGWGTFDVVECANAVTEEQKLRHTPAPSGVLRRDNSPKPAYDMLKKLIKEEWTTEITAATDENGRFELYGFRGDYEISARERSAKIMNSSLDEQIVVI